MAEDMEQEQEEAELDADEINQIAINAKYVGLSGLMLDMMEAAADKNPNNLVLAAETFIEDCSEFLQMLYDAAGVSSEDVNKSLSEPEPSSPSSPSEV